MSRRLVGLLVLALLSAGHVHAGTPDPVNVVPAAGATFITDLQTYLKNEISDERHEMIADFVASGCLGATAAGLTHTPSACVAYPGGYRVTEIGSITYPNASTCWVIVDKATTGNVTGPDALVYTRVTGTHYATNCTSATQGSVPTTSTFVMKVVTSGGAITIVTDLRRQPPVNLLSPQLDVAAFGAKCDGMTDDTVAFGYAITAAELLLGGIIVPEPSASGNFCKVTSGFTLARSTRVTCRPGGIIKFAAATGTLFTFNGTTGEWEPGGITRCKLLGNGGPADTSTAIRLTGTAQGLVFEQVDISGGFGTGLECASSSAFAWEFNNGTIRGCRLDGVLLSAGGEHPSFTNTKIFNNAQTSATSTGIRIADGITANLYIGGGIIDANGDGTLAQIDVPPTSVLALRMTNTHMENDSPVLRQHIACRGDNNHPCSIEISNSDLVMNSSTLGTKSVISLRRGNLQISNSLIQSENIAAAGMTGLVTLGDVNNNTVLASLNGVRLVCGVTAANCQYVKVFAGETNVHYAIRNSVAFGSGASPVADFGTGNVGCEDLNATSPAGVLRCTDRIAGGSLGLTPTDAPPTCSTALRGSFYYDLSLEKLCYCDGTQQKWCRVSTDLCGSSVQCS